MDVSKHNRRMTQITGGARGLLMQANNLLRSWILVVFALAALSQGQAQDIKALAKPSQSVTTLPDGHVLLSGGLSPSGDPVPDAFLLDGSGNVQRLSGLLIPRAGHTATVLPNGSVLVFGGMGTGGALVNQAEVFDPVAHTFSPLADTRLIPRAYHSATLLTDGKVLMVGGVQSGGVFPDDVQLWDWRSGQGSAARRPCSYRGRVTLLASLPMERCASPGAQIATAGEYRWMSFMSRCSRAFVSQLRPRIAPRRMALCKSRLRSRLTVLSTCLSRTRSRYASLSF
jgi:Galactose oxidase, central domain